MDEGKLELIHFASRKYTYDILECLASGAKRFKDLYGACEGEKMRSQRLRELEDLDLITIVIRRIGRRPVSLYGLSEKGRNVLNAVGRIKGALD